MYTQCPRCDTAFRVTAPDLQRAAGRVPCRGCGRDFNALERLTEDPPESTRKADDTKSILASLEELTGPHEIRIEDTGVEWRVIEDDDAGDDVGVQPSSPDDPPDLEIVLESPSEPLSDDTGSVRWYIEDLAASADDTALPQTHGLVTDVPDRDRPQTGGSPSQEPPIDMVIELSAGNSLPHPQEILPLSPSRADGDVQRYDDNTPLPDDFLDDRVDGGEPALPQRRAEDHIGPRSPEADDVQVDLALGEPDDWMELLDEVGNPRYENAPRGRADALADTDVRLLTDGEELEAHPDFPSDIDTQFDLQAIEMGIDLTGNRELELEDASPSPFAMPREAEEKRVWAEELALVPESGEQDLDTDAIFGGLAGAAAGEATADARPDAAMSGESSREPGSDEWLSSSDAPETQTYGEDAEERLREQAFERELASAYAITLDDEPVPQTNEAADSEHFVPPPTEEEMTINMLIDQDLLRLAEQQNVFTAATVHDRLGDSPHVETIIMEGEFVRTALEAELLAAKGDDTGSSHPAAHSPSAATQHVTRTASAKAPARDEDDLILGTYLKSKDRLRGGQRRTDPPSYTVIGGVAMLALILTAQVVHANRESLATYAMFDRTVGSVYRLFGEPLIPDWDITDWQFESTSGSTDELDQVLTISSRITNNTARSLPYPLLHVSLTDRWEEIVGSKVLEPADYLAGTAEPLNRVPSGEHFTAVVRVEGPSPDATGFKLNVCYREAGNRVRCATEDFKD
jgi:predicted Zn finger-like uncharacterized protein